MLYERIFCMKVLRAAFLLLHFGFRIFGAKIGIIYSFILFAGLLKALLTMNYLLSYLCSLIDIPES